MLNTELQFMLIIAATTFGIPFFIVGLSFAIKALHKKIYGKKETPEQKEERVRIKSVIEQEWQRSMGEQYTCPRCHCHDDNQSDNGCIEKMIKSFVAVGDVIEVEHLGEVQTYKVEQFEVIMNNLYPPTEFVIHVKFSYNDGISSIECTSDNFKYIRHISHCNQQ